MATKGMTLEAIIARRW